MRLLDDLGAELAGAGDGGFEVVDLEPEEHAVAVPRRLGVDEVGMVLGVPRVQLHQQLPVAEQPIVDVAVLVLRVERISAEQLPIPLARRTHVAHGNERLRSNAHAANIASAAVFIQS